MSESKTINLYTKATQIDTDGNRNNIEFFVEGSYIQKCKIKYITYKETAVSGMEGTTTTLRITEDGLSIIRFGTYNSKLEFVNGKQTSSNYQTPYGTIPIIINTTSLIMDINEQGESIIQLEYSLDSCGQKAFINQIQISFK